MSAPLYLLKDDFSIHRHIFLENNFNTVKFKAGEILYPKRTEWDTFVYIISGKVKASIVHEEKEKLLAFYGEDYIIPFHMPTEFRVSHPIQITAVSDVSGICVSKLEFEQLLKENPQLKSDMDIGLWKFIHLLVHNVEGLFFDTGIERLATFIYSYFENVRNNDLTISMKDLSAFVGLNRTNLNKYLTVLMEAHIIKKNKGAIEVLSPSRLLDFCAERVKNCEIVKPSYMEHDKISKEAKWKAICNRDSSYNGVFWYGVKSTGIFCVPSCKSRLPLRSNVEFFDSAEEAIAAGYRACKRCRPDLEIYNPNRNFIMKVKSYLDKNYANVQKIDEYLASIPISKNYLIRLFKLQYDVTPHTYVIERRLDKAAALLIETKERVLDIAISCGFKSLSNFYKVFKENYSITPMELRKREKS